MNFLKRIFSNAPSVKTRHYTVYVQPKMCREVLAVRIDTMNELSRTDDDNGFYVRKIARGTRCPFPVEVEVWFTSGLNVTNKTITDGTESTQEAYEAFIGEG